MSSSELFKVFGTWQIAGTTYKVARFGGIGDYHAELPLLWRLANERSGSADPVSLDRHSGSETSLARQQRRLAQKLKPL